jgi:hypothetical protein
MDVSHARDVEPRTGFGRLAVVLHDPERARAGRTSRQSAPWSGALAARVDGQGSRARGTAGATAAGRCQPRRVGSGPTDPASGDAVAIVTGGSRGAGRRLACEFASQGYAVVVVYLRDQPEADAVVEAILASRGTALAVRADTTDELDVERLFDETTAAFGGVDVVVDADDRDTSLVHRHALRRLRPGGAIVTVAGAEAIGPVLARELDARGITVTGPAAR